MRHLSKATLLLFVLAVVLALPTTARSAAASDLNLDDSGLALGGYDPVAYFTDGKAVKGDPDIPAMYDGARYLFADQSHRRMFLDNPTAYLPQYGGWCAYGLGVDPAATKFSPKKYPADPLHFEIRDGKLYLFYFRDDFDGQTAWKADPEGTIRRADAVWKQLLGPELPPPGTNPQADRERAALDYLAALRRQDWTKQRSFYTDDTLYEDPTSEIFGKPWSVRGGDAIVKFWQDGAAASGTLWIDQVIHNVFVSGPWVVVELDTTIRSTAARLGFPDREMEVTMPMVTTLRIDGGKVLEHRDFADYAASNAQAHATRLRFEASAKK